MIKKMLLAVAVAGATIFALAASSSAQEIHLEGITSFEGTSGAGTFSAEGEPTYTCEATDALGTVSAGGTTGTASIDATGCHTTVFGFTAKCRTSGSTLDNTIKSAGTFHLITTSTGKPGFLVTAETTTIVCAGISNTVLHGSLIGTIISPACGAESNEFTAKFSATGTVQDDLGYTGAKYDLTATTGEGGAAKTVGINATGTGKSAAQGKLNCT
jgi:hypothetical protein